ncbi:LutC/YkgG family protein [Alicyclobacillus ferrooxydans]|uniref:LUD domain-containing protein n=1 Tax=Alicyclobacillus ferrooxydans TaxID=471514 RepID=A0A0P9EZL5_9BACL|nr:lactate utilization protein C [Alicyclobacillus ferrooxydans]KPV44543.1 hypothetical protein AN477_05930 [Alicyclobacillus ferrooxydans]
MKRTEFLTRVSARLGRNGVPGDSPARDVVGVPEFWSQRELSERERVDRFRDNLVNLGGEVHLVSSVDELRDALSEVLGSLRIMRVGIWNDRELQELVNPVLESYEVSTWGIEPASAFVDMDLGITGAQFGVADTGTLVLSCGGGRGRSVHLLPPVHLAVLRASQIKTRLGEALQELSSHLTEIDSYVHFVTGPSRSSDIENDQSIGVHGPAAEIVIVVENL